jgi:uncharacterized small protein (DUF1192 family)
MKLLTIQEVNNLIDNKLLTLDNRVSYLEEEIIRLTLLLKKYEDSKDI